MVRIFTTVLVAALVLGSIGIASARLYWHRVGAAGLGRNFGAGFRTQNRTSRRVDLSAERGAVLLSAQLALRTKPAPA